MSFRELMKASDPGTDRGLRPASDLRDFRPSCRLALLDVQAAPKPEPVARTDGTTPVPRDQ